MVDRRRTSGYNWEENDPWAEISVSSRPGGPTVQAARQATSQNVADLQAQRQPSKNRQTSSTRSTGGMPGNAPGGTGRPGTTGMPSGQSPAAQSGNFGLPWQSSGEWFGGLDEYGGLAAGQSPGVFWDLYGTEVLGLEPGSSTAAFYNQNYNPYMMGAALGNRMPGYDDRLAQGTWMANQLGQPGMTFFDPAQIVTGTLQQLAQAAQGAGGDFSELSGLIGPGTQPHEQLQNILDFLGEALKGAMPPDTLDAYLNWLSSVGMKIVNNVMTSKAQGGGLAEFERGGKNMAHALLNAVGPSGGL